MAKICVDSYIIFLDIFNCWLNKWLYHLSQMSHAHVRHAEKSFIVS
jgi:hypothetical protein